MTDASLGDVLSRLWPHAPQSLRDGIVASAPAVFEKKYGFTPLVEAPFLGPGQPRMRRRQRDGREPELFAEVFGNIENEIGDLCTVETDAFYDMISTPPTSIAGLRALLVYLSDGIADMGYRFEADTVEMFIHSLHDALLDLHPAA